VIIVVDASVAVKWFLKEAGHSPAVDLLDFDLSVLAPDLILCESANVFWKKLRRGEVTAEQVELACDALPSFFTAIMPAAPLIQDAVRIARLLDHPVYDCIYVACAEREAAKLVTADQRFVEVLRSQGVGHLAVSLEGSGIFKQTGA
jgi:predicted nucleic acid-binding protein